MKKNFSTLLALAALGLGALVVSSCDRGGGWPASGKKSAEKTSFTEVTSKLDAGGSFYLYLGTEQVLDGLSTKLSGWRNLVTNLADTQTERENVGRAFDVVSRLIKDSGVEEISGLGISSIATEPGFYHSKTVLHHYEGKGSGFVWRMFGEKPHDLTALDLLPATTALAIFSDGDVSLLWSVIEKEATRSGFPQAQEGLNELTRNFEQTTGLPWTAVLESLDGEYGFVLTLDEARMVALPVPGMATQIPEPGIMIVAKVRNDVLFDRIDTAMSQTGQAVVRVDNENLRMRTVPVPLPLPIQLRPSVASSGGYLFIATSDTLIQEALAVKSGQKPGLKTTEEFQRLSKDIPEKGNQFCFMSQRFGKAMMDFQRQSLEASARGNPAQKQIFEALLRPEQAGFAYSVTANTDEGWLTIGNGNQEPGKALILMAAALPAGFLAAIAVPNFVKARSVAQQNACINNLRMMDGAKQQWALENGKTGAATPLQSDILPFIGRGANRTMPSCPQGGQYTLGRVDDSPRCTIPGHQLPN